MRRSHLATAASLGLAAVVACSASAEHEPPLAVGPVGGDDAASADRDAAYEGVSLKPTPDGACGYQEISAAWDPVNLYFVVDHSGSMGDLCGAACVYDTKYESARLAAVDLAVAIGFRANIGAAVFPPPTPNTGCEPGVEVFPFEHGDPLGYDVVHRGPVAKGLAQALDVGVPSGGTPTAATITTLMPHLVAAGKNTFAILITDGGPNCNQDIQCGPDQCEANIDPEHDPLCVAPVNCCDPSMNPSFTWGNCLDGDATISAVSSLAAAGVKVVVVGLPGSEGYSALLDELAVAGGAPRDADPRYYAITADHMAELQDTLLNIGNTVVVSCDITLSSAPSDPTLVNLWFDDKEIPKDPIDGWTYTSDTTIEVHGSACETLKSGAVTNVEIFTGCPTMMH